MQRVLTCYTHNDCHEHEWPLSDSTIDKVSGKEGSCKNGPHQIGKNDARRFLNGVYDYIIRYNPLSINPLTCSWSVDASINIESTPDVARHMIIIDSISSVKPGRLWQDYIYSDSGHKESYVCYHILWPYNRLNSHIRQSRYRLSAGNRNATRTRTENCANNTYRYRTTFPARPTIYGTQCYILMIYYSVVTYIYRRASVKPKMLFIFIFIIKIIGLIHLFFLFFYKYIYIYVKE